MKLKQKGSYYELPIKEFAIKKIIYDGLIRISFNDPHESYLDLHGNFTITKHNQTDNLSPKEKKALLLFYDLFNVRVKEANADKFGRLFVKFENDFELIVEDGPFENWHFTKIDIEKQSNNLHVHGGIGKTIF